MQNPTHPVTAAGSSHNVLNNGRRADRLFGAWTQLLGAASILHDEFPSRRGAFDEVMGEIRETLRKLVLAAPDDPFDRWNALELAIRVDGCGSVLASHAARAFVDANDREVAEAAEEELARA